MDDDDAGTLFEPLGDWAEGGQSNAEGKEEPAGGSRQVERQIGEGTRSERSGIGPLSPLHPG
jgi:hypothetical protein